LSSFTGQLAVLNAMLGRASAGSLLLLDEIATGTDPTQGAALAAAVVEALCDKGATVVATTHYAQLKGLAATDKRFSIAAVEHGGGLPTYKVVAGATGESHGLEVAGRVGMDPAVLARARHHMGDSEAAFTRALEELDNQRDRLRSSTAELDNQRLTLAKREKTLAAREATVSANAKRLEEQAASGYRSRLANAEDAISSVVAELQRAPDHAAVAKARATLAALKGLAPQPHSDKPEDVEVDVGDHVRLRGGAKSGEVLDIRGNKLTIRMGGMTLRVNRNEVERTVAPVPPKLKKAKKSKKAPVTDKAARRVPSDQAVRMLGNTLDLRGERVDEALELVDRFLDDASRARYDAVFVLHGHGTGAMKRAVRQHLRGNPYIQSSSPANADQGGDAYTVGILN
jgi:DNA mismatch repair protein MutS2